MVCGGLVECVVVWEGVKGMDWREGKGGLGGLGVEGNGLSLVLLSVAA